MATQKQNSTIEGAALQRQRERKDGMAKKSMMSKAVTHGRLQVALGAATAGGGHVVRR
jgi:hypothetical protein